MKFRDIERIILDDGWVLVSVVGSHHHYKHATKKGKVTIPRHSDVSRIVVKSILKQAGL